MECGLYLTVRMSSGTPWFWMKCAWMSFLGWVQHFFFSLLFNGKHVCIKSLLIHKFQRHERGLAVSIYCDISKANIHRGNTDFGIKECVLQPNNNYIQHNVQTMKSFSITAVWIWHNNELESTLCLGEDDKAQWWQRQRTQCKVSHLLS